MAAISCSLPSRDRTPRSTTGSNSVELYTKSGSKRAAASKPIATAGSPTCRSATARTRSRQGSTSRSSTRPATSPTATATDLAVDRSNVAELAACGRARWIDSTCEQAMSTTSATKACQPCSTLNLFAFACHGLCESLETAWEKARDVSRQRFEHLRTITSSSGGEPSGNHHPPGPAPGRDPESKQPSLEKSEKGPKLNCLISERDAASE